MTIHNGNRMELTEAINFARERTAKDGRTRYVCPHAGQYAIRFEQPTDRHCFEVTTIEVRFRNCERVNPIAA